MIEPFGETDVSTREYAAAITPQSCPSSINRSLTYPFVHTLQSNSPFTGHSSRRVLKDSWVDRPSQRLTYPRRRT